MTSNAEVSNAKSKEEAEILKKIKLQKDIDEIERFDKTQSENAFPSSPARKEGRNQRGSEADHELKKVSTRKISEKGTVAEAIVVNGLSYFLQIVDDEPRLSPKIESRVLAYYPLERTAYLDKEYEFASLEQIKEYVNRAKNESLDSLYRKVKGIYAKYIDADDFHLTICAADIIFTYFQDKIGQTHYLMFVGDNGTGKSNNLMVVSFLGYRPMFDASITTANIYNFLGNLEEGQGTILEDEADNIDRDREKMKIYKVGYNSGKKVSRIDTSNGRSQHSYWTYCFKAFSAEKRPDMDIAKGFNERTFFLQCHPGKPRYDITEIINPAGDETHERLLNELVDMRRLLLVYRILNRFKPLPDIRLAIQNREKQLCKPLLRLFQDSECRVDIAKVLLKLLQEKRDLKSNTLEAKLYGVIDRLVKQNGLALAINDIWEGAKEELNASNSEQSNANDAGANKYSCYTPEYGKLSQKRLIGIVVDKFGAVRKHDGKNRLLLFNESKIATLQLVYDSSEKVGIFDNPPNASNALQGTLESYDDSSATQTASEAPDGSASKGVNDENSDNKNERAEDFTGT